MELFEEGFINVAETGLNCGHFGIFFGEELKGGQQNTGIVERYH